jgi:hypothetical protein
MGSVTGSTGEAQENVTDPIQFSWASPVLPVTDPIRFSWASPVLPVTDPIAV